jgi:DNA-binding XRE family transcriptional regulator
MLSNMQERSTKVRTNLKVFRIKQVMSQQEMAAKLGYERAYFGHVERGLQHGSAAFWERMQTAFGLTDEQVQELKKVD